MTIHRLRRAAPAVAFSLACALAPVARAQSDTGVVSRELLSLVLRQLGEGTNTNARPIIAGGSLNPELSAMVGLPSGARVVGTIAWPTYVDILGTAPGSVDDVRQWFGKDFEKRGYTPADVFAMSSTGGFRDPVASAFSGYCSNGRQLTATARPRDVATAEFRVRVTSNSGVCMNRSTRPGFLDPSVMPMLYNPPTSQRAIRCVGGYGATSTGTQLSTTLSPSEIVAHYAKQLESLGWKDAKIPSSASGFWVKKDTTGRDVTLSLSVIPSAGASDCKTVNMSVGDANR